MANYKRKRTRKYNVSCYLCKPTKRQGNRKTFIKEKHLAIEKAENRH